MMRGDHQHATEQGWKASVLWIGRWLRLAACIALVACDGRNNGTAPGSGSPPSRSAQPSLAATRLEVAKARLAAHQPAAALVWLAAALEADPAHADARTLAGEVLAETTWLLPETVIDHGIPVEHLTLAGASTLWVALGGENPTIIRWNLEQSRIEAVLFPTAGGSIRSVTCDPGGRWMIVERAGMALLCDARTLKPIRHLGHLPAGLLPTATIAFSPDGLLLAHPAEEENGGKIITQWHLREAKSGEVLRSVPMDPASQPAALAAFLGRDHLRVLLENGNLTRIPIAPLEEVSTTPATAPVTLEQALFNPDGQAALARLSPAPHSLPQTVMVDLDGATHNPPTALDLLERHPWTRQPSIWSGLMRDESATLEVDGPQARFPASRLAETHADAEIAAIAKSGTHLITGTRSGRVTFFRLLPPAPRRPHETTRHPQPDPASAAAFSHLAAFLAGAAFDPSSPLPTPIDTQTRLKHAAQVDPAALGRLMPDIDAAHWPPLAASHVSRNLPASALTPLADRLLRANSRPEFPETTRAFETGDHEAVLKAIRHAPGTGPEAARNLELALASNRPEWIAACLDKAHNLPPLLRRIATSRIAWLEGRTADAIAGWPDDFPNLQTIRLREDWDGWEAANFAPALEQLRHCVGDELAKLKLPENPTPDQRKTLIAHLTNQQTIQSVGKTRFARACLEAALALSAFKDETEATFQLASLARNLGEDPAPCLRAEAMALTALGDYQQARERWVSLITDHPVAKHQPGDYAEAAYTSFENADPRQAMAILTTGIHRFPDDANFALRAGWVALLTGNAERAYRFLLTGRQIGYPEDKLENATALMAIAAVQTGAVEDAAVFYQDLIRMDPVWEDPATIDTLEWPEELKASLRQLAW